MARTDAANNIAFLRFLLACTVLVSHAFPLVLGAGPDGYGDVRPDPLYRLTGGQTFSGTLAVCLFFVLSGYLVTQSWERSRGVLDYAAKRALRIYPAFVVACLFCAFVAAPFGAADVRAYADGLRTHLFSGPFLRNLVMLRMLELPESFVTNPYPRMVNGSLWSLFYEAACYAALPLVAAVGGLRRRGVGLGLFAASWLVFATWWAWRVPDLPGDVRVLRDTRVLVEFGRYFLAGVVLWSYRDRLPTSPAAFAVALAALAAGCFAGWKLILPVAGAYAVWWLAFAPAPGIVRRWGEGGDYSYGVFLYGFPVQQMLVHALPDRLTPGLLVALSAPIALGLAYLSWHFVEKPMLALKPGAAGGKAAAAPR